MPIKSACWSLVGQKTLDHFPITSNPAWQHLQAREMLQAIDFGDIGTQPSQLSHSPERAPHCSHGILFVGWVVGDGPVKPSGLQNSRCCVPQYHNEDADEMRCRDEHGQGSNTNSKLP